MILKVRTRSRNIEEEYIMFDGIRRLSKFPNFVLTKDDISKLTDDHIFLAHYNPKAPSYEKECCRVKCYTVDGTEFTVVFDTIAFLMSDTGKTIEKLSTSV